MRVVEADTYTRYTGDTTTDEGNVLDAIDEAQVLLEERLGRQLGYGLHTERLVTVGPFGAFGGAVVYPSVTPILSSDAGTVAGDSIHGVAADGGLFGWDTAPGPRYATVSYFGGFTPDTLPRSIARDISLAANQVLQARVTSTVPAGATSVKVGDVAISYGPDGPGAAVGGTVGWSADTLRWRRRGL